jgi:hypothetical protein
MRTLRFLLASTVTTVALLLAAAPAEAGDGPPFQCPFCVTADAR